VLSEGMEAACDVLEAQATAIDTLAKLLEDAGLLDEEMVVNALRISNGGRRIAAYLRDVDDA
jgi:hypothetical protein